MTLNDIRNKSGLLILVIGVAMLGFILTDLMNSGTSLFQKSQNILLKVGDEEVSFVNFEKDLENNINTKFANAFGSVDITDAQRNTERDLLWDQTIEEILFFEKFNKSGIDVGKTESWDLISGEITGNQAPLFGYFFRDQTESGEWNQYNPEMIQSWIEIGSDNPQWFRYLFFKDNIVNERRSLKYYTAIKKGLYATTEDAKSYYVNQTQSASGQYIYIPTDLKKVIDNPSEREIKQYYKNNKLKFENSPNREITYFIFNLQPSENDKNKIMEEMLELISDKKIFNKRTNLEEVDLGFSNTNSIENFISQYGDNKYQLTHLSKLEFEESINDKIINNNIIEPYFDKNVCIMGRIIETNNDSVNVVYLEREIYASDETLNEVYSNVYDIINNNSKINDLNKLIEEIDVKPRVVTLAKMDQSVPGLGVSRQIVRWAFNQETNLNEPRFFELEDKYIVAILSTVSENEFKSFLEVYDDINVILKSNNSMDQIIKKFSNLESNNLDNIATTFNVEIKTINQLRLNSDIFGTEGYNPSVVGAFFGSRENQISDPFISKKGVFIFQKENEGKINYPTNFTTYKNLINKKHDTDVDLFLVDVLKENKKIIDNRFNFY